MNSIVVFDCEFLTAENSQSRYWCGPSDPDPIVVQIGAAKLELEDDCLISELFQVHIIPRDRHSNEVQLEPFFTELTGIDEDVLVRSGVELPDALAMFDDFSVGGSIWSWGKDELNLLAISCYVAGLVPPIPASRFDNACKLFLRAGMSSQQLANLRSSDLAAHYGLESSELKAHNALDDARSIALALQHLLRTGKLSKTEVSSING